MFNSATPWTVACQVPLSMGFPRQEYWSGLPFRFQGDLSNPGIKHGSHALATDSLPLSHQGSPSLCPQLSSVHFSCSVMSDSLSPHGLHHARHSCPTPTPRACSNSCPLIESVMLSNHLILCRPLLLQPSIFPSIRVFSNESALRIRWPKYWSSILNYSSTRRQNIGFILAPSPNPHCPGQKKITLAALVNVWNVFWCVKISCTVHLSMYIFISVSKITQIN